VILELSQKRFELTHIACDKLLSAFAPEGIKRNTFAVRTCALSLRNLLGSIDGGCFALPFSSLPLRNAHVVVSVCFFPINTFSALCFTVLINTWLVEVLLPGRARETNALNKPT
jgi:hypothetical protein